MADAGPETRRRGSVSSDAQAAEPPSGFILKLFQMVNGAPDEVISWVPSGDAFIIGSDLKRLESETLPQFFRHNRFQSLVRQLNFYSFRKINRERNVWVYKHSLFHRDRPEDLHLVRRRTCPGMDGRKQRFSRFSARKLSQNDISDDESSIDTMEESIPKRKSEPSDFNSDRNKRMRRFSLTKDEVVVNTAVVADSSVPQAEEDYSSLSQAQSSRKDMADQSLVVSEVASKLEEFVRKAMKGRVGTKRRGQSGVVTPPYGHASALSNGAVLSYDDEYPYSEDGDIDDVSASSLLLVVSDADSLHSADLLDVEANMITPSSSQEFIPFDDVEEVQSITRRIFDSRSSNSGQLRKDVVEFCLANSPLEELDSKVLKLISSSEQLAFDFQKYREALQPQQQEALVLAWEREASRLDAVRDFKTFAVNCLETLLRDLSSTKKDEDKELLERAARFWRDCIRI